MLDKDTKIAAASLSLLFRNISEHEKHMLTASRGVLRGLIAPLVSQLGITEKTSTPIRLFDSACGAGVLTQEVQAVLPRDVLEKSTFLCADKSQGMVDLVKKRVSVEGWTNVEAQSLDAMSTGLPDNSFSHIGMSMALHLIPDPDAVIRDCKRILQPGGIMGATTFDRNNTFWIPDVRSAFKSFPFDAPFPETVSMQMHDSGEWTNSVWIESHLKELGLKDVEVTVDPGTYHIADADEYIETFGMMLNWFMSTWWSEEVRREHPVDEVMVLLKKHLEEKYGGEGWDISWLLICMTGRVEK